MIELKCISTGSEANCYLLCTENETLIIDMGIKYTQLITKIDNLDNVVGGVLSHEHTDHNAINGKNRTSDLLEQIGIKIISPANSKLYTKYKLGNFEIIPVECKHNVICYGYVIKIENKYIYFATDTFSIKSIENLHIDYFIVECNYCDYLCEDAMIKENTNLVHLQNIMNNHQSLDTLNRYFNNLGYKPNTIITIHKSNSGYFDSKLVTTTLKDYADNFYIANNNSTYILGE